MKLPYWKLVTGDEFSYLGDRFVKLEPGEGAVNQSTKDRQVFEPQAEVVVRDDYVLRSRSKKKVYKELLASIKSGDLNLNMFFIKVLSILDEK